MANKPSIEELRERWNRLKPYTGDVSPTEVLRQERDTLAGDCMEDDAEHESLSRKEQQVRAEIGNFRAGDRLTRDEIHDRAALRGEPRASESEPEGGS